MNQDWRLGLLRRLSFLTLCCVLLGIMTGNYGWSFAVGLLIYLVITLSQLLHLHAWLRRQQPEEPPPEGFGLWADVFDGLYQMQQHERRVRQNLQMVINRVQESTAALQDAIIVMNHSNLEWCNKAAEHLLGLRAPQDFGQPVTNLVRHPAFKDYFDRGRFSEPLELASPVNDRVHLQFTVTSYGDGEHLMLVRDTTRIHQLEQMRKDFVANVSHELRTPLTVIVGYLETLLEQVETEKDLIDPRWVKPLKRMEQQTERMRHLLEDLLLLTKLETTNHPSANQPVVVSNLLESIKTDARSLSADRGHQFSLEADSDLLVKGSESELRSAFSNLVFNAVKYTPAQGKINIRWWHDDEGAHLCVQDNGIGIDSKHLPRLTERFYRADSSRASTTGGTGLGLAIVKHVLLRHKGWLEIQSAPGQGSSFICHLPLEQILVRTSLHLPD